MKAILDTHWIFLLGCFTYLITEGIMDMWTPYISYVPHVYIGLSLISLGLTPFTIKYLYNEEIIDTLFAIRHKLPEDFSTEDIAKIKKDINKRYFIGEGKLLLWALILLVICFQMSGETLLCQITLGTVIYLRIIALCVKSLFIGVLKDLDLAEKNLESLV